MTRENAICSTLLLLPSRCKWQKMKEDDGAVSSNALGQCQRGNKGQMEEEKKKKRDWIKLDRKFE